MWVYAHSGYVKCSDATFSSFNELCGGVERVDSSEYPFCNKMEHNALQPFFFTIEGCKYKDAGDDFNF